MAPLTRITQRPLLATLALAAILQTSADAQTVGEYEIKAAFLFNFVKFVEWPPQAFKSPGDPILVCLMGQNPFGNALAGVIKGKTVEGRELSILSLGEEEAPHQCQILFVSSPQTKRFLAIAGSIKAVPILTVGDAQGFATDGGMINFRVDGARVRFQINVDAAEQAHLRISSKLLSLAEIIKR